MPIAIQDDAEAQMGDVFSASYTANILEAEIVLRADFFTELNAGCGITIEQNKAQDYTFNTGELRLGNTGNDNYVSLISDPSLAITYDIKLPITGPIDDGILIWDSDIDRLKWLGLVPMIEQTVESDEYFEILGTTSVIIKYMELTPGATGDYEVNFSTQFNTSLANVTAQCVIDLNNLYTQLQAGTVTNPVFPPFTTGTTILPGIYFTAAAVSIVGTVTLNGLGNSNSIFIFRNNGACGSAASSLLNLTNGALPDNVFFVSVGAISLGANCNVSGTFLSSAAAVGAGAGASVNGRLFSKSGAIGNGGNINIPDTQFPFVMGLLETFAIFATNGALTNTGANVIIGDIATNSGLITGFGDATISGTIYYPGDGASLTEFSIYVGNDEQLISKRERKDFVDKEDVILIGTVTVTDPADSISIRAVNSFGTSKYYNRTLLVREMYNTAAIGPQGPPGPPGGDLPVGGQDNQFLVWNENISELVWSSDLIATGITSNNIHTTVLSSNNINATSIAAYDIIASTIGTFDIITDTATVGDLGVTGLTTVDLIADTATVGDLGVTGLTTVDLIADTATVGDLGVTGLTTVDLIADTATVGDLGVTGLTTVDLIADTATVGELGVTGLTTVDLIADTATVGELGVTGLTTVDLIADTATVGELGVTGLTVTDLTVDEATINNLGVTSIIAIDIITDTATIDELGVTSIIALDIITDTATIDNLGVTTLIATDVTIIDNIDIGGFLTFQNEKRISIAIPVTNITTITYRTISNFIYEGSNRTGGFEDVNIVAMRNSVESFTYSLRLYDSLNKLIIGEVSGVNNADFTISSLGVISNVPIGQSTIELQAKLDSENEFGILVSGLELIYYA
jgi:hypothetical protein